MPGLEIPGFKNKPTIIKATTLDRVSLKLGSKKAQSIRVPGSFGMTTGLSIVKLKPLKKLI